MGNTELAEKLLGIVREMITAGVGPLAERHVRLSHRVAELDRTIVAVQEGSLAVATQHAELIKQLRAQACELALRVEALEKPEEVTAALEHDLGAPEGAWPHPRARRIEWLERRHIAPKRKVDSTTAAWEAVVAERNKLRIELDAERARRAEAEKEHREACEHVRRLQGELNDAERVRASERPALIVTPQE